MPSGEKAKELWKNKEKMIAHSWKPGQSGNPAGRPKRGTSLKEVFEGYGDKIIKGGKSQTQKETLAQKMWDMAMGGDPIMCKYVFDRLEGPVKNINENFNHDAEKFTDEAHEFIRKDLLRVKQFVHPWYRPATYHRVIADVIQDESIKKVIITVPPQHGKSEIVTKTFPAHFLANNPEKSIILGTYNNEFANELSVKCRDFFLNERFQKLYGGELELHPEQQTKHKWSLKGHEGSAIFAGVGGTITGNPADVLLIDDIVKDFEDAVSKVAQEKIWNWFNYVTDSRLRGEASRIIIVMTRWVKNDLIGRILAHEEEMGMPQDKRFKVIHFPALLDVQDDKYETGRPLWPEVKSLNFLLERQKKNPSMFKSLWMGNPIDLEGLVINPKWIKIENDVKSLGEKILSCRGWDFGYTESGDMTVGARVDVYELGDQITPILADVVICRKDPTAVKEFVVETAKRDGPDVIIGVEGGGTQIAMSSDISKRRELANYQVKTYVPRGDKIARAMPWILKLEDGHFRLTPGPWNRDVIASMVDFSENCEHDDIEDAITNAWKVLFGEGVAC